MSADDQGPWTSQGGAQFPTTHWSVVLAAGDTAIPGGRAALEKLCRTYWYPLYAYVRRQGRGPEEAQDLTQAFFAQLLARGSLGTVSREKGRFRSFLLAARGPKRFGAFGNKHAVHALAL